jgi:hypothetical protein
MAKFIPDARLDVMLGNFVGDNVHVCSSQPTNYTEASSTYKLATQAITSGNYVLADGTTSGRKSTLTAPTGTSITASGTATHVAVTTGTTLIAVTTCTSQALTSGGTVDIGAFALELSDPA